MKIHVQAFITEPDRVQEMDVDMTPGDTFKIVDDEGIKFYMKAPEDQPMAIIPKDKLEDFCSEVKHHFRRTYRNIDGEHYDTADLVEDMTKFLRGFGVAVGDTQKGSPFNTHQHNEEG